MLSLFDIIALSLLLVSGGLGFFRGGIREMVNVASLLAAAAGALLGMRIAARLTQLFIQPPWAADVAAAILVFLALYITLRVVGAELARKVQSTEVLGALDRTVGLGFGLARALIVLGAFQLAFTAATPAERVPRWIAGAALYPLTEAAGRVLKTLAPKGLDMAGKLKPALAEAVGGARKDGGYDPQERRGVDDLVEKSR